MNPREDDTTGSTHDPLPASTYDPAAEPDGLPAEPLEKIEAPAAEPRHSRTGGVLIGMIVAAIVLILLLIFILQNTTNVTIHFFGMTSRLPIAVALLFAAICGLLLVAIPGTVRIVQLRKSIRRFGQSPHQRHY